jgi:hypothetical protein
MPSCARGEFIALLDSATGHNRTGRAADGIAPLHRRRAATNPHRMQADNRMKARAIGLHRTYVAAQVSVFICCHWQSFGTPFGRRAGVLTRTENGAPLCLAPGRLSGSQGFLLAACASSY